MKKTWRLFAFLLMVVMAVTCVPALAEEKGLADYEDVMAISSYLGTGTAEPMDQPNNALVKWILEKYKIDISDTEFLGGGDLSQKLGLMIASGSMPDVVVCYNDSTARKLVQQFADAGMILATEDMVRNSPNLMEDLNETFIDSLRCDDGKLYVVPSFGINPENTQAQYTSEPNLTFFKRTDLFESLGIENPQTPDELYEALVKLSEVQMEDGSAFIPLQGCDSSVYETMLGGMFGVYTHRNEINEEEQRFTDVREFPEYVEFLKYAAKLYREGLVDPELFLTEQTVAISRQREARIGIGVTWPNDIDVLEDAAKQVNPDARYNAMPIPKAEGVECTYYWQTPTLPTLLAMISVEAEDPERIMKYLDWQVSTEGWIAMCYGAPVGEDNQGCWWEEDGKFYYSQEMRDAYTSADPTYENQVLGQWTYFMAGRYIYHVNHHGFANVTESPDAQRMEAREYNIGEIYMDSHWDLVDALPVGPVEEAKAIAVNKVFTDGYQKIVMEARNDDEAQTMYDQMMEDAVAAGLRDIEKEQYERYQLYLNGEL